MVFSGLIMIITFMFAVMTKRLSTFTALIIIPLFFGMISNDISDLGSMMMNGIFKVAPVAIMIIFSVLFFAIMNDSGLFDPLLVRINKYSGCDPLKISISTLILGFFSSLTGDGSSTVLIVVTTMVPIYKRIGMNYSIIALLLLLTFTLGSILPWGAANIRVSSALGLDTLSVFLGLLPSILIYIIFVIIIAIFFGLRERKRLNFNTIIPSFNVSPEANYIAFSKPTNRPGLFFVNLTLTISLFLSILFKVAPLPVLSMLAAAIALAINYPNISDQRERIAAHSEGIISVVMIILAAGVFTGIASGTGMLKSVSVNIIDVLPQDSDLFINILIAIISIPISFFLSSDAYFFGIIPIFAEIASGHSIEKINVAWASIVGLPVHSLSPLIAPMYIISSLLNKDFIDLQRYVFPWAFAASIILLISGIITGTI